MPAKNWSAKLTPRASFLLASLFLLIGFTGCEQNESADNGIDGSDDMVIVQHDDGLTASAIIQKTTESYANAEQYSDKGVLYLSYRIGGRAIQEPQPWAVSWKRTGLTAMDLFNSKVRFDGKFLSCYVFDIESGNLDNQQLMLSSQGQPPINQLYADKIASHFVSGYNDLPLNEDDAEPFLLVPPAVGLVTKQMQQSWLKADTKFSRLADAKIEQRDCYVVRCLEATDQIDIWIDKENHIIWQADLPKRYLDAKVRNSKEISELRLIARFHSASFRAEIASEQFVVQPRPDVTFVSEFVSLPEALASELIGTKTPNFELKTQSGKPIAAKTLQGKTTALLWIAGEASDDAIRKIDELKTELPEKDFQFAAVYSDIDLADSEAGIAMNMGLNEIARETSVPFYYDQQLATSTVLRIKSIPVVVVLGPDSMVQFARTVTGDDWLAEVKAAMQRVSNGENIADEMLSDYKGFLEKYHEKLLAVSEKPAGYKRAFETASHAKTESKGGMGFTKSWSNSRFKSAGNMVVVPVNGSPHTFVFDGWRTMVEIDESGKVVKRRVLDLPAANAVSYIKTVQDAAGKNWFALFMPESEQAFVFDKSWQEPIALPVEHARYGKISDCSFADTNGDGSMELVIAFGKTDDVKSFDLERRARQGSWKAAAKSIHGQARLGVADGVLVDLERPDKKLNSKLDAWQIQAINSTPNSVCCTGLSNKSWYAMGIGDDFGPAWSISIGPQLYDWPLQPICSSNGVVAISNSDNEIHFVSDSGKWLGDFKSETTIRGFGIYRSGAGIELFVSTEAGVSNWSVEMPRAAAKK